MPFVIHVSVVLRRGVAVLLVQEQKPENYTLWNLPGGHLEMGEAIPDGAIREAREETGLSVELSALLGVYTSIRRPDYQALRFVYTAQSTGEAIAGDDILAVRWFTQEEIAALPDAALVGGKRLRAIMADVCSGQHYPLSVVRPIAEIGS